MASKDSDLQSKVRAAFDAARAHPYKDTAIKKIKPIWDYKLFRIAMLVLTATLLYIAFVFSSYLDSKLPYAQGSLSTNKNSPTKQLYNSIRNDE